MDKRYDIIVVGAGHAGCEAAVSAARLGAEVLLITIDMTKVAFMSCNPSIGGIAKGQIVREIDALGGCTGIVTDFSTIQFRMLNRSKGPAMWSPRAQCDRSLFSSKWRSVLESTNHLNLWQDSVTELIFEGDVIKGVVTELGARFFASAVILTAGTFLNGVVHNGKNSVQGGRIGEPAITSLTNSLVDRGITTGRMKTGTPPRLDARSIDLSKLIKQFGDVSPSRFSFLPIKSSVQERNEQLPCYVTYTSTAVHDILRSGFTDSPLFSGRISGIGPRYCPSIEDKLKTFPTKEFHQLFLEPEGWNTCELYLQGFSSSLSVDVQTKAIRQINGLENVQLFRPGYAVEYDYFGPTQLSHSLELKNISGLFLAGQVIGTTGYEEAAALGLMAGINAVLKIKGEPPFVIKRDQAYIGVLIDDLVTKGVDEPYRMFTSRAEYRILLRQDNADSRLTPLAYELGLASDERMRTFEKKQSNVSDLFSFLQTESADPCVVNPYFEQVGSSLIDQKKRWLDLLARPQVSLKDVLKLVSRETDACNRGVLNNFTCMDPSLLEEVVDSVEITVKYKGYIDREHLLAQKILRLDHVLIPKDFPFSTLESLSTEARQKLSRLRPSSIGQASRIPGVSPADISVLLIYFGR